MTPRLPGFGPRSPKAGFERLSGERELVRAPIASGGHLVVSTLRLVEITEAGEQAWSWSEVDHASFNREDSALTVAIRPRASGQREELVWELPEPGLLPASVHERLRATLLISESIPLSSSTAVDVTVRRDLATQAFTVQVTGAPPVGENPALDAQISAAIERVSDQVGATVSTPITRA